MAEHELLIVLGMCGMIVVIVWITEYFKDKERGPDGEQNIKICTFSASERCPSCDKGCIEGSYFHVVSEGEICLESRYKCDKCGFGKEFRTRVLGQEQLDTDSFEGMLNVAYDHNLKVWEEYVETYKGEK